MSKTGTAHISEVTADGIAVLTIDYFPVNALSEGRCARLARGVNGPARFAVLMTSPSLAARARHFGWPDRSYERCQDGDAPARGTRRRRPDRQDHRDRRARRWPRVLRGSEYRCIRAATRTAGAHELTVGGCVFVVVGRPREDAFVPREPQRTRPLVACTRPGCLNWWHRWQPPCKRIN